MYSSLKSFIYFFYRCFKIVLFFFSLCQLDEVNVEWKKRFSSVTKFLQDPNSEICSKIYGICVCKFCECLLIIIKRAGFFFNLRISLFYENLVLEKNLLQTLDCAVLKCHQILKTQIQTFPPLILKTKIQTFSPWVHEFVKFFLWWWIILFIT